MTLFHLLVFSLAVVVCVSQDHILVVPNSETAFEDTSCSSRCYSLQHVLTHHELFFRSNTTIELLPGEYVVNETFGNIEVEGIEHFTMVGAHERDDTTMSTIYCTKYGKLGFYFINVNDVSINSISFSYCNGHKPNEMVIELTESIIFSFVERIDINILRQCTVVLVTSSNISLSKVTIDHSYGVGLLVLGVRNNFQLSHSSLSHNIVNCMIITKDLQNSSVSTHKYAITDSQFAHGNVSEKHLASGLSVLFAHEGISNIHVTLSGVVLLNNSTSEGNLAFVIINCDSDIDLYHIPSASRNYIKQVSGKTTISIVDTISENTGENNSKKGLTVNSLTPVCNFVTSNDVLNFTIDNSTFIRSCIELNTYFDYLRIKQLNVRNVSCTCDYVLSFVAEKIAIQIRRNITMYIIENLSIADSCGAQSIVKLSFSNVTFQGSNRFKNNNGTVFISNTKLTFKGETIVTNSISESSSPFRLEYTKVYCQGNLLFEDNVGSQSGGLTLISSDVSQKNGTTMKFIRNHGYNGGALAVYSNTLIIGFGCMEFVDNVAMHYGGAIYVDDASFQSGKYYNSLVLNCFYRKNNMDYRSQFSTIVFQNNTASLSGNAMYGGWVDFCQQAMLFVRAPRPSDFIKVIRLNNTNEEFSVISSNPSRVCLCINSIPQCKIKRYRYEKPLSPGQSFQIHAVAVGQRFGTVPSTVIAEFVNASVKIDEIQQVQNVRRECTVLNYTIKSPNSVEIVLLKVEKNYIPEPDFRNPIYTVLQNISFYKEQMLVFDQLSIVLTITKCPLGYSFNTSSNTCTCQETLTKHGIECHLQNQTVIRTNQMWINATFIHTDSEIGNPGVVVHQHCPFDYCKNLNQQYLDLQYPDDQCDFGRSGVLCGECPQDYSHVFGTSKCKQCSNVWTLLVVPLFILTGIGLVTLLILLDLTVSIGTINGLIFYAHIVRANQASFFPPQMANNFLSWFIAWLNLDLGVEMCFFDGLDAYIKTWLQFLFPLYIWIIVIVIIVSSHYYTFAARLSGSNAVQVLVTLFLMSYAKMLRITITILSSTSLEYPDGHMNKVWLYNGNVDYLKSKHIPLFIVALILLTFLSIPYTIVLLCIQWLRLLPSYRILFWVRKLKPLFDAYTGVYKRQHGYWTGLLLLVRVGLFLVFAVNVLGDPSVNLLAVAATTFCLFAYLAMFGGVYRQRYLNTIEYLFLLNLGISSTATLYTRLEDYNQEKVTTVSVGIAFSTFVLIVFYHAYQRLKSTHKGGMLINYLHKKFFSPLLDKFKSTKNVIAVNITQPTASNKPEISHNSIELREPLLIN